ncbi:hypothetical protein MKW98_002338 [Papaver atlanticum]|uniref:Dof zinc finger protein n=1 Tax=Papaver atlanticum TaxID=357466 RepID=A0AAD4RUL8_9MAGN|nr:hypothetical protein MKW98_002338 [Papaver atlanticum]
MVFTSVPLYLDPPNWHQQTHHHQPAEGTNNGNNPQLLPPQPPAPSNGCTGSGGSGGASTIKPGSMADRDRMAKLPQPEIQLKCPRCDSANTKFCYFNNYSLTQPRHFCKTCRRYWTRGGALRNVPVGGGCRRNKRPSKSSSKSQATTSASSTSSIPSNSCTSSDMIGHISAHHQQQQHHHQHQQSSSQIPNFMASLHNLTDHYGVAADLGLNYGNGTQTTQTGAEVDFHMDNSGSVGHGSINLSSRGADQWRIQQLHNFPYMSSLEQQSPLGLYPFIDQGSDQAQSYVTGGSIGQVRAKPSSSLTMHGQIPSVKMEAESNQGLNLSRQFLGIPLSLGNDIQQHQYLGGSNAWTDLSGFTSSSTNHIM